MQLVGLTLVLRYTGQVMLASHIVAIAFSVLGVGQTVASLL